MLLELTQFLSTKESAYDVVGEWFNLGSKTAQLSIQKLQLMFLIGADYPATISKSRQLSKRFSDFVWEKVGLAKVRDEVDKQTIVDFISREQQVVQNYLTTNRREYGGLIRTKIPFFTSALPRGFMARSVPGFDISV